MLFREIINFVSIFTLLSYSILSKSCELGGKMGKLRFRERNWLFPRSCGYYKTKPKPQLGSSNFKSEPRSVPHISTAKGKCTHGGSPCVQPCDSLRHLEETHVHVAGHSFHPAHWSSALCLPSTPWLPVEYTPVAQSTHWQMNSSSSPCRMRKKAWDLGKEMWGSRYLKNGLVWGKGAWTPRGQIPLDLQTFHHLEMGPL